MPRQMVAVSPNFGPRLKELREQRRLSLRRLGKQIHCSHGYLWDLEAGHKRPSVSVAAMLDAALGANGELSAMVYEVSADSGELSATTHPYSSRLTPGLEFAGLSGPNETVAGKPFTITGRDLDNDVRRRELLPRAAAALGVSRLTEIANALLDEHIAADPTPSPSPDALLQRTMLAKTLYQACNYERLLAHLSPLLASLAAVQQEADGKRGTRLHRVAADAYHVAASVLLKNGDHLSALTKFPSLSRVSLT